MGYIGNNHFKVPPLSNAKIRSIAENIRRVFSINGLYFPIVELLDFALPIIDKDFILIVKDPYEMGSNHGETIPAEHTIILRNDVYEGMIAGNGRDRFTACHELSHYLLLNKNVSFARCAAPDEKLESYEDSEWQANCLAGELLIPARNELIKRYSVSEIMKYCGVSRQAAEIGYNKIQGL